MDVSAPGRTRGKGNGGAMLLISLVCLGLFLICHGAPGGQEVQQATKARGSTVCFFFVDDQATAVCVAGSFNSWSDHTDCMTREGDTWSTVVSLAPGRYQYVFVVDGGSWQEDQTNPLVEEDGFGARNSVLIVE